MLRELSNEDGLFASSLDADSEGEEGKFYVWEVNELKEVLEDMFAPAKEIYNINSHGSWEHRKYILHKRKSARELSELLNMKESEIFALTKNIRSALFEKRKLRIHPDLDHKCLTSWNGLAIIGLAEAYEALQDLALLKSAEQTADFILTKLRTPDRGLFHTYTDGQAHIPGFLEDYSGMIAGLITLYQITFNEERLHQAVELLEYVFENFYNKASGMFFFTSS